MSFATWHRMMRLPPRLDATEGSCGAAAGGQRAPLADDDAGGLRVEDLLAGAHAVRGRDERGGLGVR